MKSYVHPILFTLLLFTLLPTSVFSATHYIRADGLGDFPFIQDGVNATANGDTVLLAARIYTGLGNIDINFNGKAITVTSESGRDVTIIDCQGLGRGFIFISGEDTTSILSEVTIRNGQHNNGGGIYSSNASPTLTNNKLINNSAVESGGGIYCVNGNPIVRNSMLTGNSAIKGGGIFSGGTGTPVIEGDTLIDNHASDGGGGICCAGREVFPTIRNLFLTGNSAGGYDGGGILCLDSSPTITNNTFTSNYSGGALCCRYYTGYPGAPMITHNVFRDNESSGGEEDFTVGM